MAHLPEPALYLDVKQGAPTECNHPPDLGPFLPRIRNSKPDGMKIHYLRTEEATLTIWKKIEIRKEDLHDRNWFDSKVPVQDQEDHETCWSVSGAENISDALYYNDDSINKVYVPYSSQYLVDFVDTEEATKKYEKTKGKHYCYPYPAYEGLEYAMNHGIPRRDDWTDTGCGNEFPPSCNLGEVRLKHVLNDVKSLPNVKQANEYLKIQPLLGCLAIFQPDFRQIRKRTYRGPTSKNSKFVGWHSVSLRAIKVVNGETIGIGKNTHGIQHGNSGHFEVSLDIVVYELETKGKRSFGRRPGKLFNSFTYGEVRPAYQKKVVECYLDGHKIDHPETRSKDTALFILEAIFNHTSGHDGQTEVIGVPIERALLKWALKLQLNMNVTYSKSGSTTIESSPCNSMEECIGIAVDCHKSYEGGIRVHWKGNPSVILGNCTKYDCYGEHVVMSESKRTQLRDSIKDMAARNLICIALAYQKFECTNLPRRAKRHRWRLPCKDLILLAIFGIEDPCRLGKDDDHHHEKQGLEKISDEERIMDKEIENEAPAQDDASLSSAIIAADLLSSARLMRKLDNVYTKYSAQYLVENACPKKEAGQGETDHHCSKLTVKDGLKFALKEGIPKEEDWLHLGCMFNRPSFSHNAARVCMKGEVIETASVNEALEFSTHQPVGAKLHVFSPDIDLLGDGIYIGSSCEKSCYVGLRNVIIYGVTQMDGQTVASVKMCYGNKVAFIKVSLEAVSLQLLKDGLSKTGSLLVDFCLPRLSVE
ncbi:unnamed protein product [Arabis nemorensis]|uniref:Peptidase C1A papain C-terminal domain-containing protein n=1 Tax=Arabis nemorensis TaxID=586526 RepID=A0A565CBV9_9BRAS|nr:unnamed protein product [Arabis nemorensis]